MVVLLSMLKVTRKMKFFLKEGFQSEGIVTLFSKFLDKEREVETVTVTETEIGHSTKAVAAGLNPGLCTRQKQAMQVSSFVASDQCCWSMLFPEFKLITRN